MLQSFRHRGRLIPLVRYASDFSAAAHQPAHYAPLNSLQPNYSFKPSPLRGLGAVCGPRQRAGLTQALGLQEQSQRLPGRSQSAVATCITHHASRNSHYAVSRSKAHLHRTAHSFLFGTKIKVKIYSPQTSAEQESCPQRRPCPTSCYNSAVRHVCCAVQSKSHRPNNSFKPTPLRGVGKVP